ncbi:unnamed protein product [Callosobruchus maculatus]|uniref:Uncharacterized protein n=1 Tax=Callosobruchus maculatus TaxID=64391 RepID=A0A653DK82_CALMS|nr:unnamed protein product [Callosobruchus maculatus]
MGVPTLNGLKALIFQDSSFNLSENQRG